MPPGRRSRRGDKAVGAVAAAAAATTGAEQGLRVEEHYLHRREALSSEKPPARMLRVRTRSIPADSDANAAHVTTADGGIGTSKDTQMHNDDSAVSAPPSAKGKEREHEAPPGTPHRRQALHRPKPRKERLLRFTSQRSPFHSSEVGPLASRQPAAISVGLFRSDYPYLPSGRRKMRDGDVVQARNGHHGTAQDVRAEKTSFESLYNVPEDVMNGNVFQKGYTRWMLDDDMRLAVPDDTRQPRRTSAVAMASNAMGRKWYRWKAGEGYVLSRYKDYSSYKNGPGIALGQLLPPRDRPTVGRLPFIPNDSKRDLVWLIVVWLFALTALALAAEVRAHVRAHKKGKRRSAEVVPSIRIFDDGTTESESSPLRVTSFGSGGGTGALRTRQRTQARNFRDMCKAALFPGGSTAADRRTPSMRLTARGHQDKASSSSSSRVGSASSMVMRNFRWVASSASATISSDDGGKGSLISGAVTPAQDVLPTVHHSAQMKQRYSDDGHTAPAADEIFPGKLLRRGRSVSPYMGPEQTAAPETSWAVVQAQDGGRGSTSASFSNTSNESVSSNGGGSGGGNAHVRPSNYPAHIYNQANGFAIPYPAKEA